LQAGVLFDYDDTLAPTEEVALGASYDLVSELLGQIDLTKQEFVAKFPGTTFRELFPALARDKGRQIPPGELEELVEREKLAVMEALRARLQPMEGSITVLEIFQNAGREMAIVTSSALDRVRACVEATGQARYFPEGRIFSAQSIVPAVRPKPEPDIYIRAVEALARPVGSFIAVEDSPSGVTSARRAGLDVIGFVGAIGGEGARRIRANQLFESGALLVTDLFSTVPAIISLAEKGRAGELDPIYGKGAWIR